MGPGWCWRRAEGEQHELPKLLPNAGNCHAVVREFVPARGKWQEIGKWVYAGNYMIYLYILSSFANLPDLPRPPKFSLRGGNAYAWQIGKSVASGAGDD
jgi:hypothetical protein